MIFLLVIGFALDFFARITLPLIVFAVLGVLPTIWGALVSLRARRMTIDTFNTFAVIVSFATREFHSAGFIALMLVSARLLEWFTESRTHNAMEELLKLKPTTAIRERNGKLEDVAVDAIKRDDVLIVKADTRVPVDGIVIHGTSHVNESSVTGESAPVIKTLGDIVLSATLVESGVLKIRATNVGKDSTIERMAALMREASTNKSHSEKLADRFAGAFLPIVALVGLVTYVVTRNVSMTAALFLVACADDMAVAIPLAMTASLGAAAKRGVIIKGGEWLDVLGRMKSLVLDKTGTLTYGSLAIKSTQIAPSIDEKIFWKNVGIAEKYSEHPMGKTAYREAITHVDEIPDADDARVYKGSGIWAKYGNDETAIGNEKLLTELKLPLPQTNARNPFASAGTNQTHFFVYINGSYAGTIVIADIPRLEAAQSIREMERVGITHIRMFTGDNPETAAEIAKILGITEFHASMSPEDKLREIETLVTNGEIVGMVGDGINDAPALARADIGIAMGGGGTAVAAEAADVVILTDNLSRIPEMVTLGKRTVSVIRGDMIIWFISNVVGFALVLSGIAGPAFAAFYNFATDFFPLINSSRLFQKIKDAD